MFDPLNIAIEPPDEAVSDQIHARLRAFNRAAVAGSERRLFNAVLRDGEGRLQGALLGSVRFDVMNLQDLYVEEPHRRDGHGAKLVAAGEAEARRLGAKSACVMTFSWQARPFYEKQGYTVFAEVPFNDGAHTLYWLKKLLCA
jgi:GNAT superfamily N-acetyltransferase